MNTQVYNEVKKEFDIKRTRKLDEFNLNKKKVFEKNPLIEKLETEKNNLALKITKSMLTKDNVEKEIEQENLKIKLDEIDKKIVKEYKKIGIEYKDFVPNFDCKICKDTGYIIKNGKTSFCNCFLQEVINKTYKQYNMLKLEEENFNTFDFGYYSSKIDKEKYGIDKSPRENIENIRKISENFAKNIVNKNQKNLLFIGNTGLGKTFLANSIAKFVIDDGYSVIYQTAPILMDKIMEYKFSYDQKNENKEQYNNIFNVDLLIIDDLGTETMTNNKYTELFNIINTRLLNNKKILISTNLSLNELLQKYDERVISRLIGEFNVCKFVGDDIRLKKKRIS